MLFTILVGCAGVRYSPCGCLLRRNARRRFLWGSRFCVFIAVFICVCVMCVCVLRELCCAYVPTGSSKKIQRSNVRAGYIGLGSSSRSRLRQNPTKPTRTERHTPQYRIFRKLAPRRTIEKHVEVHKQKYSERLRENFARATRSAVS